MKKNKYFQIVICLAMILVLLFSGVAARAAVTDDPTVTSGSHSPDGSVPVHTSQKIMKSAKSAILYELTSDTLVYGWNPDLQMEPSSLTKIMTALIAVENGDLNQEITVSWQVMEQVPSNALVAGLKNGEILTLEQLLYLMMVGSANDAACIIADHISGSQEAFVQLMNERALELGCTGTIFLNAHGIHQDGHVSTARDLLKMLRKGMEYPQFAEIFNTSSYTLEATNMSEARDFETTNYMASRVRTDDYYDSRVTGGRTGNTDAGYRNLAVAAEQNGTVYLSVVLEAQSEYADNGVMTRQGAFEDTALLLDLGFEQCNTVQAVYEGQILEQLKVVGGESDVVICAGETAYSVVPMDLDAKQISTRLNLTVQTLTAPVEKGTYVGEYRVYYGDRCIANVPLYTKHHVNAVVAPSEPGNTEEEPGFDPGALTTALMVLGLIFAVILALLGGLFLTRWLRGMQGKNRKQKRRFDRRRSK